MKKLGIVLAALAALAFMIAAVSACAEETSGDPSEPAAEATTEEPGDEATTDEESETAEAPEETAGQENARRAAEAYLASQAFSKKGLIRQLKFEGYSTKDAAYAVGAVDVDWNEQAAKAAAAYLDSQAFSRSGLVQQLRFEGYTKAQAEYGVSQAYE